MRFDAIVTTGSVSFRSRGWVKLMGVKVALASCRIDIKQTDAELLLFRGQHSAYNSAVVSSTRLLYVKEKPLTFGGKGYNINRTLFHGRCVSVATLREQPVYSYNFAPLTFDISIVGFFHK